MSSKLDLFKKGHGALQKLTGSGDIGYICPICLRVFPTCDGLTREHVPPKAIGGKVLCLTCDCNSKAGSEIDAHAHDEMRSRALMSCDGERRRVVLIFPNDNRLNVDMLVTARDGGQAVNFQVLGKRNDPKIIERVFQEMDSGGFGAGTTFQVRDRVHYDKQKADISYLRSAYLAAFAKLGYAYILSEVFDVVRRQIQYPEDEILEIQRFQLKSQTADENLFLVIEKPIPCLGVKVKESVLLLPPSPPVVVEDFWGNVREQVQRMRATNEKLVPVVVARWPKEFELALDYSGDYKCTLTKRGQPVV
jgi:hypothetical protein